MKKYILFVFTIINTSQSNILVSCPCEFSADDERPFFEQYEVEENTAHMQKEDVK